MNSCTYFFFFLGCVNFHVHSVFIIWENIKEKIPSPPSKCVEKFFLKNWTHFKHESEATMRKLILLLLLILFIYLNRIRLPKLLIDVMIPSDYWSIQLELSKGIPWCDSAGQGTTPSQQFGCDHNILKSKIIYKSKKFKGLLCASWN